MHSTLDVKLLHRS